MQPPKCTEQRGLSYCSHYGQHYWWVTTKSCKCVIPIAYRMVEKVLSNNTTCNYTSMHKCGMCASLHVAQIHMHTMLYHTQFISSMCLYISLYYRQCTCIKNTVSSRVWNFHQRTKLLKTTAPAPLRHHMTTGCYCITTLNHCEINWSEFINTLLLLWNHNSLKKTVNKHKNMFVVHAIHY